MDHESTQIPPPPTTKPKTAVHQVPYGVNEERLNGRQWIITFGLLLLVLWSVPRLWKHIERFETGPDYRIPYQLSQDYWLYKRRLEQVHTPDKVLVLGDSVIWGEYVLPNGTLSHFLNQQFGQTDQFINAGVNGLFPLALEGLVDYYGKSMRHQKVVLECNVLWMSSPKADLQITKEEKFNHADLVPQYVPRIPCYKADANTRLSVIVERNVNFVEWVSHLQNAYFGNKSILNWTLQDDGNDPSGYPNSYKNPFAQITLKVPAAPAQDPQRGPGSSRHRPWSQGGNRQSQFEWVSLVTSLQWAAFQRTLNTLRERGNEVWVILGPFNEHLIAADSKPGYQKVHDGIATWLQQQQIPHWVPEPLPSDLYADASHPLTDGYALLAKQLCANEGFRSWLKR